MDKLEEIYDSLLNECESIRKLGPKRRQERIGQQKFEYVATLYKEYKLLVETLGSGAKLSDIALTCEAIEEIYDKILNYRGISVTEISNKMETFDLKTASTLIPVMDGKQENIEQIIDGIELYSDCLKSDDSKKLLVSFVLKTRLSKTAKLKLNSEYSTVESLLFDIKKYLLTKKSANSLLSQINNTSQNNMSIGKFGEKLEELFVSLTIAQADENPKAREILRPINEQMAIKRFADGLRNRRLSTIISARNYSALKDAVRAAEDEELASPGPSSQNAVYSVQGNKNYTYYYPRFAQGHRNYYRGHQVSSRGSYRPPHQARRGNQRFGTGNYYNQQNFARSRQNNRSKYQRVGARYHRGNSNSNFQNRQTGAYITAVSSRNELEQEEEDINLAEFFRT